MAWRAGCWQPPCVAEPLRELLTEPPCVAEPLREPLTAPVRVEHGMRAASSPRGEEQGAREAGSSSLACAPASILLPAALVRAEFQPVRNVGADHRPPLGGGVYPVFLEHIDKLRGAYALNL